MASEGYHEAVDQLSTETRDLHRAIASLMEEFEAVDWYQQRIDATQDTALKEILAHNRDEEKEHAAMVLEWLRRRDPALDAQLKAFLFKNDDIVASEADDEKTQAAANADDVTGSLNIGSLR